MSMGYGGACKKAATLMVYRNPVMEGCVGGEARRYLIDNFAVDCSEADIIFSYPADRSHFTLVRAFV